MYNYRKNRFTRVKSLRYVVKIQFSFTQYSSLSSAKIFFNLNYVRFTNIPILNLACTRAIVLSVWRGKQERRRWVFLRNQGFLQTLDVKNENPKIYFFSLKKRTLGSMNYYLILKEKLSKYILDIRDLKDRESHLVYQFILHSK